MRVTDQQMFANLANRVAENWSRLAEAQDQIATGSRVQRPSDDPVSADRIGALEESLSRLDHCGRSSDTAGMLLEASESALAESSDLIIRARELAVQAASEQYGPEDRANAALEIRELFDRLVAVSNGQVAGRYLFSGFLSDQPAFQPDGTFSGDSGEPELEVSPGLMLKSTIRGDQAFSGAGGGVDLFMTLDDLAVALENDDTAGIQDSLDGLDAGLNQLLVARTQAGSRLETVRAADGWNQRLQVGLETSRGRIADTDLARASMQLALAHQALQATLATIPNMLTQTILDRL